VSPFRKLPLFTTKQKTPNPQIAGELRFRKCL